MKKGLLIVGVALIAVALIVPAVLAAGPGKDNSAAMTERHNKMVEQHVKDGVLTPEQAQIMNEHMASMEGNMNNMMEKMGSGMMGGMMSQNGNMMGDNAGVNCGRTADNSKTEETI